MKHGTAAKKKSAKTSGSKSSGKTAAKKVIAKAGKASKGNGKGAKKQSASKAPTPPPRKAGKAETRESAPSSGGGRGATVSFSNPAVGSAYQRAVKKYPAAFKRLSD
jgi:hypothetical protein